MFLTGARISQALAVTWGDVDFKARKVRIKATAKGDDDRFAHMPAELIAALANIGGERKGLVFEFKSRGNCKTQWAGAIRRAGIEFYPTTAAATASQRGYSTRVLTRSRWRSAAAGRMPGTYSRPTGTTLRPMM
jgi:integrase